MKWWYCWWFRKILHQLRLVVYPMIYKVLYISSRAGFWTINSITCYWHQFRWTPPFGPLFLGLLPRRSSIKMPTGPCLPPKTPWISGGYPKHLCGKTTRCQCPNLVATCCCYSATWKALGNFHHLWKNKKRAKVLGTICETSIYSLEADNRLPFITACWKISWWTKSLTHLEMIGNHHFHPF